MSRLRAVDDLGAAEVSRSVEIRARKPASLVLLGNQVAYHVSPSRYDLRALTSADEAR